jgi:hypothetical protein
MSKMGTKYLKSKFALNIKSKIKTNHQFPGTVGKKKTRRVRREKNSSHE